MSPSTFMLLLRLVRILLIKYTLNEVWTSHVYVRIKKLKRCKEFSLIICYYRSSSYLDQPQFFTNWQNLYIHLDEFWTSLYENRKVENCVDKLISIKIIKELTSKGN